MEKIQSHKFLIILLLLSISMWFIPQSFAYWANDVLEQDVKQTTTISIGYWTEQAEASYPQGTVHLDEILAGSANKRVDLVPGSYFTYQGILYLTTGNYTPIGDQYWAGHGLPGTGNLGQWAYAVKELDWMPGNRYFTGTVVRINERYFIAAHEGNYDLNPLANYGKLNSNQVIKQLTK